MTNLKKSDIQSGHTQPVDDGLVRRAFGMPMRATVNEAERSVEFVASSAVVDSYGEVVEQHWDLRRYAKNPVILWGHNQSALPVGHGEATVRNGQLVAKATFVDASANPQAELVWQGFRQGSLRGFSVGFRPGDVREVTKQDGSAVVHLGSATAPNELWEISVTSVPANPDAVALSAFNEHQIETLRARAKQAAAQPTALSGEPEESDMDPKEHERLVDAAEKRGRADAELTAKSALETKDQKLAALEIELTALRAEAAAARGAVCEAKIAALVGKKLMPSEVGHYVKFAQKAGLEDVLASLEARPDLPVLAPVDGRPSPVAAVREASADEGSRSGQSLAALFTPRGSN